MMFENIELLEKVMERFQQESDDFKKNVERGEIKKNTSICTIY